MNDTKKDGDTAHIGIKIFTAIMGFILITAMIKGCNDAPGSGAINNPSSRTETESSRKPDIELVSYDWKIEEYSRYIVGTVKNNSDKRYSYLQVSVPLFDKQNNRVGSAFANIAGLDPGQTWKFKAIALEDGTLSAGTPEISGR